jgi:glycerol dehydrogenase
MAEVASQALIGPRKYIQGRGVIGSLGEHVGDLGKDALVVADENVWKLVGTTVESSLQGAEVRLIKEVFGGECSHREIDRITEAARKANADVVVGGKTLDAAKAVGHRCTTSCTVRR